jgi:hypothetical protein
MLQMGHDNRLLGHFCRKSCTWRRCCSEASLGRHAAPSLALSDDEPRSGLVALMLRCPKLAGAPSKGFAVCVPLRISVRFALRTAVDKIQKMLTFAPCTLTPIDISAAISSNYRRVNRA